VIVTSLKKLLGRLTSTSWRLHVTGLILGCVVGAALYYGTTAYFMHEAEARVLDLLLQNRALHQYIQLNTHPALFEMEAKGLIDSDFYSTELLSSSFMARHVTEYLNQERHRYGLSAVVYRIAAVNPRNPTNAADDADRALIERFNASREMTSFRSIITTDSGKYLRVSLPFLETGEACLKCHGNPEVAPKALVNKYGMGAGFNAELHKIRAMESIEAPLESDILQARILFLAMFAALASTCFLIFIVSGLRRKVRKHTAQLAASEQKYRMLVEDLPCFVCSFLPDGTINYVNKLQADYFQMTPEQMIGRRLQDIVRQDVWQEAESQYTQLTVESPIGTHELRVVLSNGSVSWQHWILGSPAEPLVGNSIDESPTPQAVKDAMKQAITSVLANGQSQQFEQDILTPYGRRFVEFRFEKSSDTTVLCLMRNVTARKEAEKALHASEERNRALLNAIPDNILLLDSKGDMIDFHGGAGEPEFPVNKIFGRTLDEVPMPPEVREEVRRAITEVIATGQSRQFEHELHTQQGHIQVEARFVKCSDSTVLLLLRNVTDRKETEEALCKSETVMRGIFNSAPVGIILVAPDRTMLNANAALCSLSGYKVEELIGQSARILYISEEEYERAGRDLYRQMKEHGVGVQELCMRHKDGYPIFVILRLSSCDPNDPSAGVIATVFDVTERKLAEEALRKSEHSYRVLSENLPCAVYRIHLRENYRIEFFNEWILQMTGYGSDELCQHDIHALVKLNHPDDQDKMIQEIERAIREETSYAVSYRLIHRDGSVRYLLSRGTVVMGADGSPLHIDCVTLDFTERIQSDVALRQSEAKYRSYVDNAPDAVMVVDKRGRLIEVNPAAERMTGYKRQELLELSIGDLLAADTSAAIRSSFIDLDKGDEKRGEIAVRRKDHGQVWWSVDGVKLADDRYLSFCVDITETRRLRELESRAQRLETAGRIAGQVAHDFNNLLAPLTAYPDMIREDLPKDHPALVYLSSIEDSAYQIAEINQQLLTLGRRGHYNQDPMDLNEVVGHVLAQMDKPPESLVIDVSMSDELMPMMGGRSQIHRVLMNLVQNAREAMQDIGRISIRTENSYIDELTTTFAQIPRGEYVKLTISDTGCGILPEIIEKIFDPFFTTKQADRKRGSGLGLSVVDAVVNDHHGYVDLKSEVGKGTSIYLYFPITRATADDLPVESVTGGVEHVLVVDDDQTQREVCLHILERLGYQVEAVMSGEKALELLQVKTFDLLILDMIMPAGIDGTETYRQALNINPRQRAIMLSGFAESDRVIEAQNIGAGAFLRKPVTRTALALAVRRELDRIIALPTSV
jgi:PAS domain S-box-containing protein